MNLIEKNNLEKKTELWIKKEENKSMLRFLTCGSVDDGKSTLIGRLLHDTQQVYEDQINILEKDSKRYGTQGKKIDLALLIDGLQAEQEQGITIDVAYRYFSTKKRKFIIADTPGHEQYTKNMATGASTCDAAILLVDARKGLLSQTYRHTFIVNLLGIHDIIVAINKMDLVKYKKNIFDKIKKDFLNFFKSFSKFKIKFIPISALLGENIIKKSSNMNWYKNETLLDILENIEVKSQNEKNLRFPVQYVNRSNANFRGYCGTLASGTIKNNQKIKVLPSNIYSKVIKIIKYNSFLKKAVTGESVTLVLENEIDISRGDLIISHNDEKILLSRGAIFYVVWMNKDPLLLNQSFIGKIAGKKFLIHIKNIKYKININTFKKIKTNQLFLNEIGLIDIDFEELIPIESYLENKITGGMIFIDPISNSTVGMGMVKNIKIEKNKKDDNADLNNTFEKELKVLINKYFPHWNLKKYEKYS